MIPTQKQNDDNEMIPMVQDPFHEISYECYKELLGDRVILLNGFVKDDIVEKVLVPLIKMSAQKTLPIQVWINSPGGSIEAGQSVVDAICNIPNPVITVAFGQAMSAAFDIFLAGDHRITYPNTLFMCHSGSATLFNQTLAQINQEADLHKEYFKRWAKFYASRTKINEQDWITLLNGGLNRYFFAEEAVEKGIAHQIMSSTQKKIKNIKKLKW